MKHLRSTLAAAFCVAACAIATVSCNDNKNSYELHQTNFYPTLADGIHVYADQTVDSTHVVSTDNWTFTTTEASWLKATNQKNETAPFTVTVPVGYIQRTAIYFDIEPNTTGKMRTGLLTATSVFEKIGAVHQYITQAPYLNITTPSCTTTGENESIKYTFTLPGISSDGKYHTKVSDGTDVTSVPYITFTVYSSDATLTSSEEWLIAEKADDGDTDKSLTFSANKAHKVNLILSENKTGQQRSATLTLTSNGVSTPITIVQEK